MSDSTSLSSVSPLLFSGIRWVDRLRFYTEGVHAALTVSSLFLSILLIPFQTI